jgi:hypothetical protein
MSDLTGVRIDKEKAMCKWSPVFENIGYKGTKSAELAMYCEIHAILENAYTSTGGPSLGPFTLPKPKPLTDEEIKRKMEENLLPMSVRILTQIENLNSDKVTFNTSPYVDEYQYVEIGLNKEEVEEYKQYHSYQFGSTNMDLVQRVEGSLIKLAIEKINNEIGNNEVIFDTGRLAKSIELVDNKTDSPKIRLNLRYSIKNK